MSWPSAKGECCALENFPLARSRGSHSLSTLQENEGHWEWQPALDWWLISCCCPPPTLILNASCLQEGAELKLVCWVTLTPNPQRHTMPCEPRHLQAEGLQSVHHSFPLLLVVPGTVLCWAMICSPFCPVLNLAPVSNKKQSPSAWGKHLCNDTIGLCICSHSRDMY